MNVERQLTSEDLSGLHGLSRSQACANLLLGRPVGLVSKTASEKPTARLRKSIAKFTPEIGKKFHWLEIVGTLELTDPNRPSIGHIKCKCRCGTIEDKPARSVINETVGSCRECCYEFRRYKQSHVGRC